MVRWTGWACSALAVLVSSGANAGFYSGDELYKVCTVDRGDRDYVERSYECLAYVTGAVDAFHALRSEGREKSCIPADVTIRQLRDVTADYLRAHPNERAGSAAQSVFAAMRQEWPCSYASPAPAKQAKHRRRRP